MPISEEIIFCPRCEEEALVRDPDGEEIYVGLGATRTILKFVCETCGLTFSVDDRQAPMKFRNPYEG